MTSDQNSDTFIDVLSSGFTKGVIFVNGRNLGRYWKVGPQKTLYLPGSWLKKGENSFVIFEEYQAGETFELLSAPNLGK